jgi:hypothetical protein
MKKKTTLSIIIAMLVSLVVASNLTVSTARAEFILDPGKERRATAAPPTDAKASLTLDMPPGVGILTEYTLARGMLNKSTPVANPEPTGEVTPEPTPRPRSDTDLEPPIIITSSPPEKEFFVIKTRNDKIFYLIIDRTRMSDNVYLVTEVDEEDLLNFLETEEAPSLLPFPPQPTKVEATEIKPAGTPAAPETNTLPLVGNLSPALIITAVVLLILSGAALFYWKVVKPKDNLPSESDFYEDDFLEESQDKDLE